MVGLLDRVGQGRASGTIVGGFARVPVGALAGAWRACRARPLGIGDFRAWLALREIAARRGPAGRGRAPEFGTAELASLLGVSGRRAAASARRLGAAGLVRWSAAALEFPGDDGPGDDALADSIGGGHGHLAVPRRILRHLAKRGRPALIATALGVLLRCLSRRRGGFDGRGRVKASWIARAFGVDTRAVKAARKELVALGWIAPLPSGQLAENRWGRAYRVDLAWAAPGPPAGTAPDVALRHPPPAPGCRTSPPPLPDQDPLQERGRNQEPAPGGPAGIETGGMGRRGEAAPTAEGAPMTPLARGEAGSGPAALPAPRLADVRPEDLVDAGRLLELHRQAMARGLIGSSEADRIRFAAAAEHARAVGRRNPCGLFARLVAKGWWDFATLGEEERAARRLKEHLAGPPVAGPRAFAAGSGAGSISAGVVAASGTGMAAVPGAGSSGSSERPGLGLAPGSATRGSGMGGGRAGDQDRPAVARGDGPSSLGEVMARLGLGRLVGP